MYYAGNGKLLAGFEKKAYRDCFIEDHCSWGAEKATSDEAMDYPQFIAAKCHPYEAHRDDGFIDEEWTFKIFNSLCSHGYFERVV